MKSKVLSYLTLFITLLLVVAAVSAAEDSPPAFKEETAVLTGQGVLVQPKGASGPARYIVQLSAPPVAGYTGGVHDLSATSPRALGEEKLDPRSAASLAYAAYLQQAQTELAGATAATIGRSPQIVYTYQYALNGVVMELSPDEAAAVAQLPGVVRVERDEAMPLQTDAGPGWIGAPSLWDGSATYDAMGTQGEGVIVGVIDSGINMGHPSFAAVGPVDGYVHENPFGDGQFVGWCDPANPRYNPRYTCNNKLIGAWDYADTSWASTSNAENDGPNDSAGHGSHTASTAAGNVVDAVLYAPTTTAEATISGVAPHANIIAYDVCAVSCYNTDVVAAVEQAIRDGVDVINESIGLAGDTWSGGKQAAYLAAFEAGIFYARSAGNDGPGAASIGPEPPWTTAVAATTHNRVFVNGLTGLSSAAAPLDDIAGLGFTAGYGPAPILYAATLGDYDGDGDDDSSALCGIGGAQSFRSPWPEDFFNGEIIVCDRGVYGRVEKGANLAFSGAGGYVLANAASNGDALTGDAHALPAVHIGYEDGELLKAWLRNNDDTVATIAGVTADTDPANADVVADFSSRGPAVADHLLLPDLAAPGVDIWAAVNDNDGVTPDGQPEYGFLSGTSMASPHAAGAAALLVALHPDWTPAEIKSALMSTANNVRPVKEDGATPADPFDVGAGRVDLTQAAKAGLVLNETAVNFENANPAGGGDPRALNLPSLANSNCVQQCTWTRVVRNVLAESETWQASLALPEGMSGTVTPQRFTLAPGATQALRVRVSVGQLPTGEWQFARLDLTPQGADVPPQHMPIALIPNRGEFPDLVQIETRRDAGSYLLQDLTALEITDLRLDAYGLVAADSVGFKLAQDPTGDLGSGGLYDDLNQVYWRTVDVPAGAVRLVSEIVATSSPDLDLALGYDANGNGRPDAEEETCLSAGPSWTERCNVMAPAAGRWWVLVMNWQASQPGEADVVELATAVVPNSDAGNLDFDAAPAVPALEPFDVRILYDVDARPGDRWYGAFSLGTDASSAGNIGMVAVDLYRLPDDVVKSATPQNARPGDTVTFTITVRPNMLAEDVTYELTDQIPAGMSYVPGSATASYGAVNVSNGKLIWTGTLASSTNLRSTYRMTTSENDPQCDTGFDGYINLEDVDIKTQPSIEGDTVVYAAFSSGLPIDFYDQSYKGLAFTDDGFAVFNPGSHYDGTPWEPQTIPNGAAPNNLAAVLWRDFEIFYDANLNHGVSLATAGDEIMVIEYDDVQFAGGSTETFDFEIVMRRSIDDAPGIYEIVYAYDNLSGALDDPVTVGVENEFGDRATALVNNGSATAVLRDGLMVCFDAVRPLSDPVAISYQARVSNDAALGDYVENSVVSTTSNAGSAPTTATTRVYVGYVAYSPAVPIKD